MKVSPNKFSNAQEIEKRFKELEAKIEELRNVLNRITLGAYSFKTFTEPTQGGKRGD